MIRIFKGMLLPILLATEVKWTYTRKKYLNFSGALAGFFIYFYKNCALFILLIIYNSKFIFYNHVYFDKLIGGVRLNRTYF